MAHTELRHALARPPADSFVRAISSAGAAIDVRLARAQHTEYCQALAAAGLAVETLPADERYPDGCFMQDPAVVIAGQAVVCRMAMASRSGEEEGAAVALAEHGYDPAWIRPPGTLEGGDVLVLPGRVLVGETARSNQAGIAQLATILEPLGLPVSSIPVPSYLHLLSAVTYLGHNLLLAAEDFAGHPALAGLDIIPVPEGEIYAVNTLAVGQYLIAPAGYPRLGAELAARGFTLLPVCTTEFAKADGGVTCLSLVW